MYKSLSMKIYTELIYVRVAMYIACSRGHNPRQAQAGRGGGSFQTIRHFTEYIHINTFLLFYQHN